MKKIIYTRPDGGLSVVHPAEGSRLAKWVVLEGGDALVGMRTGVIELSKEMIDAALGGIETIMGVANVPRRVDEFLRHWPVAGAIAEWAETEDEFVARIAAKDVPADAIDRQFVDEFAIPTDRTFRNAWKAGTGNVEHDIPKCKELAHNMRREKRVAELAPLDDIIAKQIPGNNFQQVEAQRQVIREKYASMQTAIDAAQDVAAIKAALGL